jgi:hypothetical protein
MLSCRTPLTSDNTLSCRILLTLDNTLSYRTHIDTIIPKLSSASFALRVAKSFLSQDSLKMVYYTHSHSIMTYGLIFWGSSHYSIIIIFRLQKRIIRIIVGIKSRDSCGEYFKKLKIFPLQSQYLPSLLLFVVDNGDYFKVDSETHNINTRNKSNLHLPISSLSLYQKGKYYSWIRVLISLPSQIKNLSHNRNQFKCALKDFLYFHSFYTLDEYFSCNRI